LSSAKKKPQNKSSSFHITDNHKAEKMSTLHKQQASKSPQKNGAFVSSVWLLFRIIFLI